MLRNPARCARRESKSALRCFISTATKRASGKRAASGSASAPLPAPKSTTVVGGQSRWLCGNPDRLRSVLVGPFDVSSRRVSRSSRSTVAKDSTCHRFRRARVDNSGVSVFFFSERAHRRRRADDGIFVRVPTRDRRLAAVVRQRGGVAGRGHGGPVYRRGFAPAPRRGLLDRRERARHVRGGDRQPSQDGLHRRVSSFGLPATLAGLVRPVRDERGVIHVVRGCAWVGLARAQRLLAPPAPRPGPHRAGASETASRKKKSQNTQSGIA